MKSIAWIFLTILLLIEVGSGELKDEPAEEPRTSFSPTTTTNVQVQHSPRFSPSPAIVYAQNREAAYATPGQPLGIAGYSAPSLTQTGGYSAATNNVAYGVPTASSLASHGQGNGQGSMTYYYYHYPAQPMGQYGTDATGLGMAGTEDDFGLDGILGSLSGIGNSIGGIGGLAGLLGLKGLKGLKGLGGIGLLALFKILKPILLLPLFLPLILLLPLLLLFIPVPVITIPNGRSMEPGTIGEAVSEKLYNTIQRAKEVLSSGECVERIACEMNRKSKGSVIEKIATKIFEKAESYSSKNWQRGMRAFIDSGFTPESKFKCEKYQCSLYSSNKYPDKVKYKYNVSRREKFHEKNNIGQ